MQYDFTIITAEKFCPPKELDWYTKQVLLEDELLKLALEKRGFIVDRNYWSNPDYDWSNTKAIIIRACWDYFHRYQEFSTWLDKVKDQTQIINPYELIKWNLDKHYLLDLEKAKINIPASCFIETGDRHDLAHHFKNAGWQKAVLKPTVSGSARHTYLIDSSNIQKYEAIYSSLIQNESMIIQEYLESITTKGEITLVYFGNQYSHAVLKKAKQGDFRVQDDFGGTVHDYQPTKEEIEFAKKTMQLCPNLPYYGRVDIVWDNKDEMAVSELELIEPELWMRKMPEAADLMAERIAMDYQDVS